MKNIITKNALIYGIISVTAIIVLSSCLSPDKAIFPTRVQVALQLENIGSSDPITAGQDEMTISRVRILHGGSFFRFGQDSLFLLQNEEALAMEVFTQDTVKPVLLARGHLIEGQYSLLNIQFPQAPESPSLEIDSVFTEGGRFSIIVEGSYNDTSFTYKSARNFKKVRTFSPPLNVPEFGEEYMFLVSSDVAQWFAADDGQSLLNPADEKNSKAINDNIAASINITMSQEGGAVRSGDMP